MHRESCPSNTGAVTRGGGGRTVLHGNTVNTGPVATELWSI